MVRLDSAVGSGRVLAIFVHGLATPEKHNSMSALMNHFYYKGIDTEEYNYGFLWLGGALDRNWEIAEDLAKRVDKAYARSYDHVIIIGHSNGCALINMASKHWRKCDVAVYLHGAVPRDELPDRVKHTLIYYCPDDLVISLLHKRILYPFKTFREKTGWGDIGIAGYEGDQTNFTNIKISRGKLSRWESHRAVFAKIKDFGPKIVNETVHHLWS